MDRLVTRVERLPDDSHLWGAWGRRDELAAQTVELLQVVVVALARLGNVPKSKLPKLTRIPRPGTEEPKLSPADKIRGVARLIGGGH